MLSTVDMVGFPIPASMKSGNGKWRVKQIYRYCLGFWLVAFQVFGGVFERFNPASVFVMFFVVYAEQLVKSGKV